MEEKANNKLNALRQGKNVSFLRFLLIFEKLLLKAGGLSWPDKNKILALKAALHPALREAFILVKPPTGYDEYVSELIGVALRKEAAKAALIAWHTHAPRSTAQTSLDPNAMDWESLVNAAAVEQENEGLKGKRAKWVTKGGDLAAEDGKTVPLL